MPVSSEGVITIPAIGIFGSSAEKVRDWRSMLNLFQVNHGTIITLRLVSLAEDGIQGFVPMMRIVDVSHGPADDIFHSLNGVSTPGSQLEKVGIELSWVCH